MRILNLSLDSSVADPSSAAAERMRWYGEVDGVEKYIVIVPAKKGNAARIDDNQKPLELSPKVSVIEVAGRNKLQILRRLSRAATSELAKARAEDKPFDLITVQDVYYLGMAAVRLARRFDCVLEVQVHGFEKFRGFRKLMARRVIAHADGIRAVSRRLANFLQTQFAVAAEKISVISLPLQSVGGVFDEKDRAYFKPNLLQDSLPAKPNSENKGEFIFLTVARLVPVKNIASQIRALADIARNFPQACLWIVGDGPERTKLEQLAVRLGLNNGKVFFAGQVNHRSLFSYYSKADAFLLTSDSEGWGMTVIEAASHGLPIIMTDVGCAGEVIKDGQSGLVVPVGINTIASVVDSKNKGLVDRLGKAMVRLVQDSALRERLGKGAADSVRNLPSKEATLVLYKKAWQNAIAARTSLTSS